MDQANRHCSRPWRGSCLLESGTVTLDSASIAAMRPRERAHRLAFVSSTPPRGTALTVSDVMELALEAGGHPAQADRVEPGDGRRRRATMGADALRYFERRHGPTGHVGPCGGTVRCPGFLDEPTAFLDVVGRREVMADVGRMAPSQEKRSSWRPMTSMLFRKSGGQTVGW